MSDFRAHREPSRSQEERAEIYEPPENPTRSFASEAGAAFSYPFCIRGGFAVVCFALALSVLWIIFCVLPPEQRFAGSRRATAHGLFFAFLFYTCWYLLCYFQDVVDESTVGDPRMPDWPSPVEFRGASLDMGWLVLPLVVFIGAPIGILWLWLGRELFSLNPWIIPAVVVAGGLYFPMALLAGMMFRSPLALSPHVVLPAMWRAPAGVFLSAALIAVASCGLFVAHAAAMEPVKQGSAFLGPFLSLFAADAAGIYLLFVASRIIGINYWTHRFELGWFENP